MTFVETRASFDCRLAQKVKSLGCFNMMCSLLAPESEAGPPYSTDFPYVTMATRPGRLAKRLPSRSSGGFRQGTMAGTGGGIPRVWPAATADGLTAAAELSRGVAQEALD